jgi:hypothetical protein
MGKLKQVVQWRTHSGDGVTVDGVTVTPQTQALTVRWPNGGLVWNRPVAVLVQQGEQTERMPIVDVTLVVQWILFGFSLVFSAIILLLSARQRRERNERNE